MRKSENKARYWTAVLYPENMRADWKEEIGDVLELPYAYCVHDKDLDKEKEHRKEHLHLVVAFTNTTTEAHALKLVNKLSAEGKVACPGIQSVGNIRHTYEYLIHNTETAKKQGKHQYKPVERITGNNFDIGSYEQLSTTEKNAMAKELCDLIIDREITNFVDFYLFVTNNYDLEYFDIVKSYSSFFERLTRGNFLKVQQTALAEEDFDITTEVDTENAENTTENAENTTEKYCDKCGSIRLSKDGKTQAGSQRWRCRDCGNRFV